MKKTSNRWLFPAVALLALTASTQGLFGQNGSSDGQIEIVPVRGNIYMLAGAGANITVSVGPDGVLLVDAGRAEMSDKVLAAIKQLNHEVNTKLHAQAATTPPKPIRYIANTNPFPDHTGGNEKIAATGKTFTGGNVIGDLGDATEGAAILSHENLLHRLSDAKVATAGLPTETFFGSVMKLSHFFNNEGVELIHVPNAVTDGDSIVYFRGADVISAGDIFTMESYPVIDLARGGSVQGVLAGLNRMLDMVIAEFRSEGGTFVVPGHGRICDTADLAYYRDMVTIVRDRVQNMIKKDMTLAQIKAAKPTEDWDPRFGKTTGAWTTDMFVEAVYRSLIGKK